MADSQSRQRFSVKNAACFSVFLSGNPQLTPFFISFLFSNHIFFSPSQLQTLLEPRPSLLQQRVLEPPWGVGWGGELSPRCAGGSHGAVCLEDVLGGRTVQRPLGTREQPEPEDALLVLPHEGGGGGPIWCQGRQRAGRACP